MNIIIKDTRVVFEGANFIVFSSYAQNGMAIHKLENITSLDSVVQVCSYVWEETRLLGEENPLFPVI
jgi:nitrate reductase NapAB chaperone NapD